MKSIINTHPLLSILNSSLIKLPSPAGINRIWNFGSLLGLCLLVQISRGLFLAFHFRARVEISFDRVIHIVRDVKGGWFLRMVHANGARIFFVCIYCHVARGLYYGSYTNGPVWSVGIIILLLTIATAFLGYVLPWGQISFWGATVITNLFSAIPVLGKDIVIWLWGGFAVGNATLTRFFAFHFVLPFVIRGLVIVHLLFLHEEGSNNPLGLARNKDKVPFNPYFRVKDLVGFLVLIRLLISICFEAPWFLGDPENFIPANAIVTPPHIQPEWYFLFAYAILRSIPRKLGGVIALAGAVVIFLICPAWPLAKIKGNLFYPGRASLFWLFIILVLMLTWIGARPVEEPYIFSGQLMTVAYFSFFFLYPWSVNLWDKILGNPF